MSRVVSRSVGNPPPFFGSFSPPLDPFCTRFFFPSGFDLLLFLHTPELSVTMFFVLFPGSLSPFFSPRVFRNPACSAPCRAPGWYMAPLRSGRCVGRRRYLLVGVRGGLGRLCINYVPFFFQLSVFPTSRALFPFQCRLRIPSRDKVLPQSP